MSRSDPSEGEQIDWVTPTDSKDFLAQTREPARIKQSEESTFSAIRQLPPDEFRSALAYFLCSDSSLRRKFLPFTEQVGRCKT